MKSAIRSGVTLVILLLAVFPCGAALTVLGILLIRAMRIIGLGGPLLSTLSPLWIPIAWAGGGVLGFLSLIPGVDKLMVAKKRMRTRELVGIFLGICAATQFSVSYLLHLSSLRLFRSICVAPVIIEFVLLLYHLFRFRSPARGPNQALEPTTP